MSERATLLIHEEIELAKAEVAEKANRLAKGAVVGVAAGIFMVTALFFVLIGFAWLLYYYLPIGDSFTYFWGFFAMALILVVLGVIAGLIAARVVRRSSPPVPSMAIEEARRIRETVSAGADGAPHAGGPPPSASASGPGATAPPPAATAPPQAATAPPQAATAPGPGAAPDVPADSDSDTDEVDS